MMKVFWAVMVVLVVGAVAVVAVGGSRGGGRPPLRNDTSTSSSPSAPAPAPTQPPSAAVPPATPSDNTASPTIPGAAAAADAASSSGLPQLTPNKANATREEPPVGSTKAPAPARTAAGGSTGAHAGHVPGANVPKRPDVATPREAPADVAGATLPEGIPAKLGDFEVRPVKLEVNDDGTTSLDGRFKIRGKGTREEPYQVPWELLVSAKDTFEPAAGLKRLPGRVAFLHDKFVRLDGYVAFPMMMQKPTELLSMLNQWDGCCLGVPPTPYDAVEVKLLRTVTGDARFATTGAVVGKFKVDPYVVKNPKGDWLISMYTMTAADFVPGDVGPGAGS